MSRDRTPAPPAAVAAVAAPAVRAAPAAPAAPAALAAHSDFNYSSCSSHSSSSRLERECFRKPPLASKASKSKVVSMKKKRRGESKKKKKHSINQLPSKALFQESDKTDQQPHQDCTTVPSETTTSQEKALNETRYIPTHLLAFKNEK